MTGSRTLLNPYRATAYQLSSDRYLAWLLD